MAKLMLLLLAAILHLSATQYIDIDSVNIDSPSSLHDGDSSITVTLDVAFTPSMGAAALIESISDAASSARVKLMVGMASSATPNVNAIVSTATVTLSSSQQSVDLTDDSQETWSNLEVDLDTSSLDCGTGSTYTHLCAIIMPPDAVGSDWEDNDIDYLNSTVCAALACKAQVDIGVSSVDITNPDDAKIGVGSGQAVEFDVTVSSTSWSDDISGSSNWAFTFFVSTSATGASSVASSTPTLSTAHATRDLTAGSEYEFTDLAVTLNMDGIKCKDFDYACVTVAPASSASWKVETVNTTVLEPTYCMAVECSGCVYKISLLAMILGLFASWLLNES